MRPHFENVTEPRLSCAKRPIDQPPIRWPHLESTFAHRDETFRIRPIARADIAKVCGLYNEHYPHLYGSSRHYLLDPSFYEKEAALADHWDTHAETKDYFFGLFERVEDGQCVFAFGYYKDRHDRSMQALAIVMRPEYRGAFLTHQYIAYFDRVVEQAGFDYVFGTAQVRDVLAQRVALRAGFKVGGMMPGAFRWSFDGETCYRDMLLYMYRFCGDAESFSTQPADWQLTPKVAEAFRQLHAIDDAALGT